MHFIKKIALLPLLALSIGVPTYSVAANTSTRIQPVSQVTAIAPLASSASIFGDVPVHVSWANQERQSVDGYIIKSYYGTSRSYNTIAFIPAITSISSTTITIPASVSPIRISVSVVSGSSTVSGETFSPFFYTAFTPSTPMNVSAFTPTPNQSVGATIPVTVTWVDTSSNESGFSIQGFYANGQPILSPNGSFVYAWVTANATSTTIDAFANGAVPATTTPIYFVVTANNDYGSSGGASSTPRNLLAP